ncbi:MAG: DUF4286 family protein [Gemmatimonadales bacterium]
MIRYEVTLECSAATAPALDRWMRNTHVPDMLATGCFVAIHFDRGTDDRFRTVSQAATQQQLDRYLADYGDRLRGEFRREFPEGVAVVRDVWCQMQHWAAP